MGSLDEGIRMEGLTKGFQCDALRHFMIKSDQAAGCPFLRKSRKKAQLPHSVSGVLRKLHFWAHLPQKSSLRGSFSSGFAVFGTATAKMRQWC